jgi:hypothetical protein
MRPFWDKIGHFWTKFGDFWTNILVTLAQHETTARVPGNATTFQSQLLRAKDRRLHQIETFKKVFS